MPKAIKIKGELQHCWWRNGYRFCHRACQVNAESLSSNYIPYKSLKLLARREGFEPTTF
jgi:hypothetical protein